MAVKHAYEAISATIAGATHHQSNFLKMLEKPESSVRFDESTQIATTTRPKPMATRTTGQARRAKCLSRLRTAGGTPVAASALVLSAESGPRAHRGSTGASADAGAVRRSATRARRR